jgi:hypothetical protein
VLDRPEVLDDGLTLLRWLLDRETSTATCRRHRSVGRVATDRPGFDQQPIEVAAMADAVHARWR